MRRLLTVAVGLALSAYATTANARTNDPPKPAGEWRYSYPDDASGQVHRRGYRRSTTRYRRQSNRRRTSTRAHRRRTAARPRARRAARPHRRQAVGNRVRSTLFLGQPGGGASRTCLTPAARALLGRIESQFGRVQVISTCRRGARIAGTGRISRHASGNAIDFNAPGGRKAEIVRWLIANHRSGGTMTYAGMTHIHVDIGPRFVSLNHGAGWR